MENHVLLERVLDEVKDGDLKNQLLRNLFKSSVRTNRGIPTLRTRQLRLNNHEINERMKMVAGGTNQKVAKILAISQQAYSNQICRGAISARSILDMHLKTGVSVDWLIGSWDGCGDNYDIQSEENKYSEMKVSPPSQQFLSLVEIYDQYTGNEELKWCATKYHECIDERGKQIPDDFGVLLSLINRYKLETGTPDRVKNGIKRHFQVRRVVAYTVGSPKIIRSIDAMAKKLTSEFRSDLFERTGKTEFRSYSSKDECLHVFRNLAEEAGVKLAKPSFNSIAWDLLIGTGGMDPKDWIIERIKECELRE